MCSVHPTNQPISHPTLRSLWMPPVQQGSNVTPCSHFEKEEVARMPGLAHVGKVLSSFRWSCSCVPSQGQTLSHPLLVLGKLPCPRRARPWPNFESWRSPDLRRRQFTPKTRNSYPRIHQVPAGKGLLQLVSLPNLIFHSATLTPKSQNTHNSIHALIFLKIHLL